MCMWLGAIVFVLFGIRSSGNIYRLLAYLDLSIQILLIAILYRCLGG